MSEALRRPVSTYDKDDTPFRIDFKQRDGNGVLQPLDVSGRTFKGRVANSQGDTPFADLTPDMSAAAAGTVIWWLTKAQAETLREYNVYDLVQVWNGRETTLVQAEWHNKHRVTP